MTELISFDAEQRVRLGLRGYDREVVAKVVAVRDQALWVHLAEPALWLEDHHLEGGIDLAFWRDGTRHVAEGVGIMAFDLDRGRLQLARPETTREIQRRRTFRESVELPVRIRSPRDALGPLGPVPERAVTRDLSGGGLGLKQVPIEPFAVLDELQLELELPGQIVPARGKVRWLKEGSKGSGDIGVEFVRIAEREQDRVYAFLFALQQQRLRTAS